SIRPGLCDDEPYSDSDRGDQQDQPAENHDPASTILGGDATAASHHKLFIIRVLPSVLGFTCARSRNSATPSSGLRSSCEYTSGSTTCSPMGENPRRVKNSISKVRQNSRSRPSSIAR